MTLLIVSVEDEGPSVEIVERHRRAEIDADVEGFAGGEGARHGALHVDAADFVAIDRQSTTAAAAPGFAMAVFTSILCLPGAKSSLGAPDVTLDDHHVVFVDELPSSM